MGKCVVIGLQSTGEARTLEAVENGNYSIIENYKVRKNRNDED